MKHFTSKEVSELFPHSIARNYPGGQIVVYEGDRPEFVYFVKKGALKYYDIDDNGTEKVLHVMGENSFFSMLYAFGTQDEVSSFYSTMDETELLLIPIEDFCERMANDNKFANDIFRWFVQETEFILDRIRGLEKTEGRLKVAKGLNYLASRHGEKTKNSWFKVKFPINQQFLADLVGLTRETVSVIMKDFDEQGIIHYPKQMHLEINCSKLNRLD